MDIEQIIAQAQGMAQRFIQGGHKKVRVPCFDFDSYRAVYDRPGTGSILTEYRTLCKRTWYMMRLLREAGVEVHPVPVRADDFEQWCAAKGRDLADGHERAHAVGDYTNDPAVREAQCVHSNPLSAMYGDKAVATITMFSDDPQHPEVIGVALHLPDGQVIDTLEIPTAFNTPDQAWDTVQKFLQSKGPGKVFNDSTIRRPEYCEDCGALLSSLASERDILASEGA